MLRSGPLIETLVEMLKSARNGFEQRMQMYSGHDTTISSFLNALGLFDPPIAPPYAAAVLIELTEAGQVQFLYKNETDREPYKLNFPGCGQICSLDKFASLTEKLRPSDWRSLCQFEAEDGVISFVSKLSLAIASCLVFILIAAVLVSCWKKRRNEERDNHQYSSLSQESA